MRIRHVILLVATGIALAACGADGEPVQPTFNAAVGVGSSGSYVAGGVGVNRGPVGLFVGF
ncbi:argininosuccinate lyase [Ruegeria sp.]|uniref:argininosuccinate lyase n=1 Tax=Ruegeria sp. TaxID=1879320 RepID=UPI003C7D5CFD